MCEAFDHKNYDAEKELHKLWAYDDVVNSLLEEVDRYSRPSTLDAQIEKLKASLVD